MKRVPLWIVLSLLLLSIMPLLPAHHNPTSISALIYNDAFSMGIWDNKDDFRSYGIDLSFTHSNRWFSKVELSGLTLREKERRYDEISLLGGRYFDNHIISKEGIVSSQSILAGGFVLAGKIGFSLFQNVVHQSLSIEEVDFPYEREEVLFYPQLLFTQRLDFEMATPWYTLSALVLQGEVSEQFTAGYEQRLYLGLSLGHRAKLLNEFLVDFGFTFNESLNGWETHKETVSYEKGLTVGVRGHFGLLALSYTWYLQTGQGYGGIGVDVGIGKGERWVRNDLLLSIGVMFPKAMVSSSLRYALPYNFGFLIHNSFKMIDLDPETRARETISAWYGGIDYEFTQIEVGIMRPFASVALGFRNYLVAKTQTDSDWQRVRELNTQKFSFMGAVGTRLFNRGEIQYSGVSYGIELSAGVRFTDISNITSADYNLAFTEQVEPFASIRLTVGSLM